MTWFIDADMMEQKPGFLNNKRKLWFGCCDKFSLRGWKCHLYNHYFGSKKGIKKRREALGSMCDERARMLQDQFNVSMNHLQALAILISTFHHSKEPSAINQMTFARYAERTAFERPLTSGVAYAVMVLHSEREEFERHQGWTIKRMDSTEQSPACKDDSAPEVQEVSPVEEEYAPVIFAQDAYKHVISLDMLSGKEDRENILRARESGKGVLTAPFQLLKSKRLGVILTYAVYKRELPSNASPVERIQAAMGYLGGIFDIEALVDKLLHQLACKQSIMVNVYDTTKPNKPIRMYGSNMMGNGIYHSSTLHFGDPFRKHEMQCRFKYVPSLPWLAITTSIGALVIALLIGYIFHATVNRIAKVEDDYWEMMELKKRAEAADVAKSQFLATVSHEIRTPMNGVLGMLQMLMDTELDITQQDYVRIAQESGKALVSLINEVLDQAKIESGKLELEAVRFDLRAVLDDVLSLFYGKSQEKQIEFTEKGHIYVTVHLVEEVMNSFEVETEAPSVSTLSGFPVADKRHSWESFKIFNQDLPVTELSLLSTYPDLINLIISVEDTGVGIPREAQSRVFTPFMQVGPSISRIHGGTGIGLSISKCLVGLMKGEIGFVSEPQIGSTFTFTAVLSRACSNSNQYKSSEFQGMTALVIDHRPARAKVTQYHLQRLGIHAELASDLNQVLSRITDGTLMVNMVLVDKETWLKDAKLWPRFVSKLRKDNQTNIPKLFLLAKPSSSPKSSPTSSAEYFSTMIMKPLRASLLQLSLRRAMGGGDRDNFQNGGVHHLSLCSLLHGKQILVVDDNIVNLRVAAGALKWYGADVTCAESGKKAIIMLKPPHKFNACFMDIQMPEMDGYISFTCLVKYLLLITGIAVNDDFYYSNHFLLEKNS
ncbi:Histidine kinase 3 [Cocos nucifera]|uniref:histidine kinase n=1 Tax=Cocos nucifera TaxID=13894 RepID=A0A8K0HZ35_COCNU|nr:Histidine kinase 3 [Cocos nucifera]